MTTFYAVSNDQTQAWVAAREDTGDRPVLVWLANDRTWRRNPFLEEEFYALDRDMRFEEISPPTPPSRSAIGRSSTPRPPGGSSAGCRRRRP